MKLTILKTTNLNLRLTWIQFPTSYAVIKKTYQGCGNDGDDKSQLVSGTPEKEMSESMISFSVPSWQEKGRVGEGISRTYPL